MLANSCPIEDYRTCSNQAFVSYSASMNDRTMRNSHSFPHDGRILSGAVHHDIILDATIRADSNVAVIPPDHGTRPYACSGSNNNIGNYRAVRYKNCCPMKSWLLSVYGVGGHCNAG